MLEFEKQSQDESRKRKDLERILDAKEGIEVRGQLSELK